MISHVTACLSGFQAFLGINRFLNKDPYNAWGSFMKKMLILLAFLTVTASSSEYLGRGSSNKDIDPAQSSFLSPDEASDVSLAPETRTSKSEETVVNDLHQAAEIQPSKVKSEKPKLEKKNKPTPVQKSGRPTVQPEPAKVEVKPSQPESVKPEIKKEEVQGLVEIPEAEDEERASHAQTVGGPSIRSISISGNQRIESETILSYIGIKTGDALEDETQHKVLTALFDTGYFKDVHVDLKGQVLHIAVQENAMIRNIVFEGNDKLKDDALKEEIRIKPREVISKVRAQEAQQRILEIYRRMGRLGAKVDVKTIALDSNRVDLVFEITEGSNSAVRKISFIGNKHFSARQLEDVLHTKRSRWYRFWATDDIFDTDRFNSDQQSLRQFYFNRGYADFRIVSATAELSQDQKDFFLTLTVEEGPLFNFGKHQFNIQLGSIKSTDLEEAMAYKESETYSAAMVEKTIRQIKDALGAKGYAFVDVEPKMQKNRDKKTIDITFDIKEGPHVYLERIVFIGNDYTRDEVLRREIPLHEGDAYDAQKIKIAERNLKNLNYFKNVTIDTEPGSAADQVRMVVTVEEQSTGELQFAGGFSTLDGPLGSIRIAQRNFRGAGQTAYADMTIAKKRQDFNIGFVQPYFMNRNMALSTNLFHTRSTRHSAFTQINKGASVGISYPLSDYWSQSFTYLFKNEKMSVSNNASRILAGQRGSFYCSQLAHSIAYDRRDTKFNARSGYLVSMDNAYAGLGGNVQYFKTDLGANWYYPVGDESVFGLKGSYGRMDRIRRSIRVTDSAFIGADTLRGFEYGGVGPRDKRTNDSMGATRYVLSTAEIIMPIGLPSEFGVKGAVFTDWGTAWRAPIYDYNITNNKKLRGAVGCGIMFQLPIGPIRIDYSIPIKKEKGDETQRVLLGFSTGF